MIYYIGQNKQIISKLKQISRKRETSFFVLEIQEIDRIFEEDHPFICFVDTGYLKEKLDIPLHKITNFYYVEINQQELVTIPFVNVSLLPVKILEKLIDINLLQITEQKHSHQFIVHDQKMKLLLNYLSKVAKTDAPVLLQGETGTGKEFLAEHIHIHSKRIGKPFVKVNCAAIPSSLIESELFGFKKGAFTGADKDSVGKFMQANEGTIFLDEIGEIALDLQPKLLRVLDYGEIEMLGYPEPQQVNVRIVSATNKNIYELTNKNLFREDLLYRLNSFFYTVPPLRERKNDIVPLFYYYLSYFERKYNKMILIRDEEIPAVESLLINYQWPGNIRELRNLCQNLVALHHHEPLETAIIESFFMTSYLKFEEKVHPIKTKNDQIEREVIMQYLVETNYNIQKTAQRLGISRQHLYRKMKKFGIRTERI
ncbi:MAG: hypothetical protein Kow00108_16330 [Calditrichia bacterium]